MESQQASTCALQYAYAENGEAHDLPP